MRKLPGFIAVAIAVTVVYAAESDAYNRGKAYKPQVLERRIFIDYPSDPPMPLPVPPEITDFTISAGKFRISRISSDAPVSGVAHLAANSQAGFISYADTSQNMRLVRLDGDDKVSKKFPAISNRNPLAVCTHDDAVTVFSCEWTQYKKSQVCWTGHLTKFANDGAKIFDKHILGQNRLDVEGDQIVDDWATAQLQCTGAGYALYFGTSRHWGKDGVHQGDTLILKDRNGEKLDGGWMWGVSHSFEQLIDFDSGKFVLAAKGDAYPRGIAVNFTPGSGQKNIFPMSGAHGENFVPLGLGSLRWAGDTVLLTFTTNERRSSYDIGLMRIKPDGKGETTWLTTGSATHEYGTQFVPFGPHFFMVFLEVGKSEKKPKLIRKAGIFNKQGKFITGPTEISAPFYEKTILKEFGWSTPAPYLHVSRLINFSNGDAGWVYSSKTENTSEIQVVRFKGRE